MGAAKLVVFANAGEDNRTWQGETFHGVGEADVIMCWCFRSYGVVKRALEKVRGESFDTAETVKKTAFKITRIGR